MLGRAEHRCWRSRVWLQLHLEQIENALLFWIGSRDDLGQDRWAQSAGLGADGLEPFEDDRPGPAAIFSVAVGVEQRLEPL